MRKIKQCATLWLSVLLIVCLFTGCSSGSAMDVGYVNNAVTESMGTASDDYYYAEEEWIEEEKNTVTEETDSSEAPSKTDLYLDSQKLIYSCDIEIETLDFKNTVDAIKASIKESDGFIESDSLSDNSHNWYYSDYHKNSGTLSEYLVVRIPTTSYEKFLNSLEGTGKIMSKSEDVTNITKSYNDTSTTITMLEKEEIMLLDMLEKCETIQDMMTVETRLAEVQQRLAIYKSNLGEMDMDIAFSTISIQINEVMEYTRVVEEMNFIQKIVAAIKDSADSFGEFLEGTLITLIYAIPYIAICVVIVIAIKISVKNKRKKKAAQLVERINGQSVDLTITDEVVHTDTEIVEDSAVSEDK